MEVRRMCKYISMFLLLFNTLILIPHAPVYAAMKEADYVNAYCKGQIEYVLPDKTRVDCLTDEYAIEFDWAKKWAESIGQALYYAAMTNKKPAVAIIMKSPDDEKYIKRIEKATQRITIFKFLAY